MVAKRFFYHIDPLRLVYLSRTAEPQNQRTAELQNRRTAYCKTVYLNRPIKIGEGICTFMVPLQYRRTAKPQNRRTAEPHNHRICVSEVLRRYHKGAVTIYRTADEIDRVGLVYVCYI